MAWVVEKKQGWKCVKPKISLWKIFPFLITYERNFIEVLTAILKIYLTLPENKWRAGKHFSELCIVKNKFPSTIEKKD